MAIEPTKAGAVMPGASPSDDVKTPARRRSGGLGRGLSALLEDVAVDGPRTAAGGGLAAGTDRQRDGVAEIAVAAIHPHPDQPRRHFDEAALTELAGSIKASGVLQPILVRPAPDGHGWQLVAGERRWRASQRAGLHQIPAIIRPLSDAETFTVALVENIQRRDLSAIEEAEAFVRLRDTLGHAVDAIAAMTGKSRSHITNLVRLLELPESVRAMVADGRLGMGHARAIIGAPDAPALARRIVEEGLSVRRVELLVRQQRARADGGPGARRSRGRQPDPDIAALESHLSDLLGLKVRIAHKASQHGTVTLDYSSLDQLDMLCQRLSGETL